MADSQADPIPDDELSSASKRIVSTLIPCVAQAVKFSHELPTVSTPAFTYYNDFPQYRAVMNGNANKILTLIQNVINEICEEANVLDTPCPKSLEEKFSAIVDVNDRVIDRLTCNLDSLENPEKGNNSNSHNLTVAVEGDKKSSTVAYQKRSSMEHIPTSKILASKKLVPSPVKLLASRNIARPQVLFSVAPDNSNAPFLPILKSKPNAIVQLQDCDLTPHPKTGNYTHPYLKELEAYGKCIEAFTHTPLSSNPKPPLLCETPFEFIDSTKDLENMIAELNAEPEIAVDLEHHSYRTFLGITCLMQLSSRTKDYIVDTIALRDHLGSLNKLFTDPTIVKVFHGCDMDLMWLQRDFGVYVVNLFDTGQAARALQLPRFSLSYLLQNFAGVLTNKAYQLADWRIRPLPEELVEYARSDTHYLLYIAEQLRNHLSDRGLLGSVLERSKDLCLRIYKKPVFNPMSYLSMPNLVGSVSLNKRQLYALKYLYILRDSIARREDESLHYVLPNHMLKLIAEELPRETTGIFACCSPIPPLVRKYAHDIHKIVLEARNNKLTDLSIDDAEVQLGVGGTEPRAESITTTVGLHRARPHDFSHKSSFPGSISSPTPDVQQKVCDEPSLLGQSFLRSATTLRKGGFIDADREMIQQIMKMFDPTLILNEKLNGDVDDAVAQIPVTTNEDPLYKPPSPSTEVTLGSSKGPLTNLTVEDVVEVEELGGRFHQGCGKSAQSRVFASLKQQQQRRAAPKHAPGKNLKQIQDLRSSKRYLTPDSDSKEAQHGDRSQFIDLVGPESEMDVVILRDQKSKGLSKGSKVSTEVSPSSSRLEDVAEVSQPVTPSQTSTESPKLRGRTSVESALPQNASMTERGKRRGRGRGGRGFGPNVTPRGSFRPSQPRNAGFSIPQKSPKRHKN